jgi:DNA polymerase-3 subunit alpha
MAMESTSASAVEGKSGTATSRPFVHLHCHSHYSLLDGAAPIGKLIDRVKSLGMNGLALTDHGNLHGALEFYQKAKSAGINPIIGYEAYIAPKSRFERDASSMKEASYHLLQKYNEGIICLSGCLSSEFSRQILKGHDTGNVCKEAMETAAWFHNVFGDRYFIEIMNNGIELQRIQVQGAVDIANHMGIPLVATSDAHYLEQADHATQDILLCINTGKFRTDSNRMKMENDQFFVRSPEEMYLHFPGLEDAVARSQEIANSVCIDLELGKRNFPNYTIPTQQTPDEYLRSLCESGLNER